MKKKIIYVSMALFLVMSFIACASNQSTSSNQPASGGNQSAAANATPIVVSDPTFSHWGGLGNLGTSSSPWEFLNSQPFPAMIGFAFPAGASNFNTVSVTFTLKRLDTTQLPMKLAIKRGDINGGWDPSDNISFPQPTANGQQTYEFTRSDFTGNVLTIAHNRGDPGAASAEFEITVNQIRFFNK